MDEILTPWEQLLWQGRPRRLGGRLSNTRYLLTDVRLVRVSRGVVDELAIHDIADVHRVLTPFDRLLSTSTLVVDARRRRTPSLVLPGVVRGAQVAALVEWLAGHPHGVRVDVEALQAALAWDPPPARRGHAAAIIAAAGLALTPVVAAIARHGAARPIQFSAFDAIAPNGHKRSRAEIDRFMEAEVMPWARQALGPIKGGPSHVTCETCHGRTPSDRGWKMPAVAALPAPVLRDLGWERNGGAMDAQIRNAIYGYLAEAGNQAKAAYMREVVVPGMARLLGRPAYDFTRPYEYNRARNALGCYHCHQLAAH
jgi:hypothetical protein